MRKSRRNSAKSTTVVFIEGRGPSLKTSRHRQHGTPAHRANNSFSMSEVDEAAFGASESSSLLPGHPGVVGGTGYVAESEGTYERNLFHYSNLALLASSLVARFQFALPYVAYRQYLRLTLKATPSVQASILTLSLFLPLLAQAPFRYLLGVSESRCNGLWLAAGAMILGASWMMLGMFPIPGGANLTVSLPVGTQRWPLLD